MNVLRHRGLWPAALLLSGCMSGGEVGLSEGKTAPPIQGVDVADRPMRLSDYRGQVVLLDFWKSG
jgi:hypothetical protein